MCCVAELSYDFGALILSWRTAVTKNFGQLSLWCLRYATGPTRQDARIGRFNGNPACREGPLATNRVYYRANRLILWIDEILHHLKPLK